MGWRSEVAEQVARLGASASGYTRVHCPACPTRYGKDDTSKSCSVSSETGWWLCHRCGWRGRLDGYGGDSPFFDAPAPEPTDLEEPSDYTPVVPGSLVTAAAAHFLHTRGVNPSKWTPARIGYARTGDHAGRVIFPLTSEEDWRSVGWVGRLTRARRGPWESTYHTAGGVARSRALWNGDALYAPDPRPVIVTEGVLDGLRLYPHAVACLGKPTRDQLALLYACPRPLVFALDGDAWQEGHARALQLRAQGKPAWCLALPAGADPDTYPPETLLAAARYAWEQSTDLDLAA